MHVAGSNSERPVFKCKKCGACCCSLAGVEDFADLDRGDGVCRYFDEKTRLCAIYDTRPRLCRVDAMYEDMFADQMSYEEYLEVNYAACRELRADLGIPEPEEIA